MEKERLVAVEALMPGDLVDLEGDEYADPPDNDSSILEYQYVEVAEVKLETPECTVVYFEDYDAVGFPRGHQLKRKQ